MESDKSLNTQKPTRSTKAKSIIHWLQPLKTRIRRSGRKITIRILLKLIRKDRRLALLCFCHFANVLALAGGVWAFMAFEAKTTDPHSPLEATSRWVGIVAKGLAVLVIYFAFSSGQANYRRAVGLARKES